MSLTQWFSLVSAIGIDATTLEPMEIFLVAGRILNEVRCTAPLAAIKAMTVEQRTALRGRVSGVVEFPGSKR